MSGAQRLEKIYPALTARERGLLVLQAWKEGRDEDRKVRSTMPDCQVAEFNRYIALMNGVNKHLGPVVVILKELVAQLNLKRGWMLTLQLWGINSSDLGTYIFCHTKEPICESDHARLLAAARAAVAPVGDLAEVLAEREDGSDKLLTAKKAEIAGLVEEGAIAGKRQGRTLHVNVGSFYDWLGEPTPVYPDWGLEFEIFPDDDAEKVERLRRQRETVRDRLRKAPISPEFSSLTMEVPEARSFEDEIVDGLRTSVKEGIPECWGQLRAVELVVEQVSAEFGGKDPALPLLRDTLNWTREQLVDLHSAAEGDSVLPEPDEETIGRILQLVQRDVDDNEREITLTLPATPLPAPPSAQSRSGVAHRHQLRIEATPVAHRQHPYRLPVTVVGYPAERVSRRACAPARAESAAAPGALLDDLGPAGLAAHRPAPARLDHSSALELAVVSFPALEGVSAVHARQSDLRSIDQARPAQPSLVAWLDPPAAVCALRRTVWTRLRDASLGHQEAQGRSADAEGQGRLTDVTPLQRASLSSDGQQACFKFFPI